MTIHQRLSLAFLPILGLSLAPGCSGEEGVMQLPDVQVGEEHGSLQLRVSGGPGFSLKNLQMTVTRSDASVVTQSDVPLSPGGQRAQATLALPAGLGYTLSLKGESTSNAQCSASATFNVVAGQTSDLALSLRCTGGGKGNVKVEVGVQPDNDQDCPEITFISALPQTTNVGGSIKLRAAADEAGARFTWSASSGRFTENEGADTEFICTQVGPAEIKLGVTSSPQCKDEHSLDVDCLAVAGDNPAEDQAVTLRFAGVVGDAPFACGVPFTGLGTKGASAMASDFRFFVYDVELLDEEGKPTALAMDARPDWQGEGVALVDFEEGPSKKCFGGTPGTNTKITGKVPKGSYSGVRFRIGVPARLNHADSTTLAAPLTAGGMVWSWLAGFKFLKFELGTGVFHLGSTGCSGTPPDNVDCSKTNEAQILLEDFDAASQEIVVDLAAAFSGVDLEASPTCHGTGADCTPLYDTIGINASDGSGGHDQRVFRVR